MTPAISMMETHGDDLEESTEEAITAADGNRGKW